MRLPLNVRSSEKRHSIASLRCILGVERLRGVGRGGEEEMAMLF